MTVSTTVTLALAGLLAHSPSIGPSPATGPQTPTATVISAGAFGHQAALTAPTTAASHGTTTKGSSRGRPHRRVRPLRAPSPRFVADRLDRQQLRGARSAVAIGGALFGLFYITGTLGAAVNLDVIHEDGQITPDERDERRVSQLMFVPVIGPLVASPLGSSKGETAALIGHGLLQGLAVAALITGGVELARDRRARRLALSAGWAPSGASVGLRGRF